MSAEGHFIKLQRFDVASGLFIHRFIILVLILLLLYTILQNESTSGQQKY